MNKSDVFLQIVEAYMNTLQAKHEENLKLNIDMDLIKFCFSANCLVRQTVTVFSIVKSFEGILNICSVYLQPALAKELDTKTLITDPYNANYGATILLFPLFHNEIGDGIGHWTLLILDKRNGSWIHYDSLRPKEDKDGAAYEDALKVMKCVVQNHRNSEVGMLCQSSQPSEYEIIQANDAPQQSCGSMDCGIFVMKFAKDIFEKGAVEAEEFDVIKFRGDVVTVLLNDAYKKIENVIV